MLIGLGFLALCQLFGGQILERLKIVGSSGSSSSNPGDAYPNGSTTTSPPPYPGGPTQMPEPGQLPYGATQTVPVPGQIIPPPQASPGPAPTPPAGG